MELGAEGSYLSTPAYRSPLIGSDPRIESGSADLAGQLGLGGGTNVLARVGMGGLEASLLQQLSPAENDLFAFAVVSSARGRLVFEPTGETFRLLDTLVAFPLEFDPHPRLALIVEPKGMLSITLGCVEAGTGCSYFPFHAGVSAGAKWRPVDRFVFGVEGAWYPLPIAESTDVEARPTSWEVSLSLAVRFESPWGGSTPAGSSARGERIDEPPQIIGQR